MVVRHVRHLCSEEQIGAKSVLFLREQSRLPGVSGAAPAYLAVAAGPAPTAWCESMRRLCVSTLTLATALRDVQAPPCSPLTCEAVARNMTEVQKNSSVLSVSNATPACERGDLATAWSVGWPHAHTGHLSRQQQCGMNGWEWKATMASANRHPPNAVGPSELCVLWVGRQLSLLGGI